MRKNWLWLLALGLAACGKQVEIAPDIAVKHQHGAALQRQVEVLQAEQLKVSAPAAAAAGLAVLNLEVVNPQNQPEQPDSLKQRMRKLAHLLVADLASPERYQVVNAQATFKPGFLAKDKNTSSQAFIYPLASLK